jgi:hypothetical protein
MKQYIYRGEIHDRIPDPLHTPRGSISPVGEATFLANGGRIEDNGEPTPEEEFAGAAAKFRALCGDIGSFIGSPLFTGGFEEVAGFSSSQAAQNDPMTAYALALRWMELNEECKYKGAKIGLGQPAWFRRAWELAEEEREA